MKKRVMIGIVIGVVIVLLFFFYPLCGFRMLGSKFKNNCNTCSCMLIGPECTLLHCINCAQEGEGCAGIPGKECCKGLVCEGGVDAEPEIIGDIEGVCTKVKTCDDYPYPHTDEIRNNCTCPEGKIKGTCMSGAYCTTDSQISCDSQDDCPEGESCKSDDGETWYCSGKACGCYYNNPQNPEDMICID